MQRLESWESGEGLHLQCPEAQLRAIPFLMSLEREGEKANLGPSWNREACLCGDDQAGQAVGKAKQEAPPTPTLC